MPTTTPFANLITFSRGTNATVVGPNGLVQWAPSNLLTFSEQFDNAAWGKFVSASVTANTTTAPDGTATADTLTLASTANSRIEQTVTVSSGQTYTFSVWMRVASGTLSVRLYGIDAGGGSAFTVNTSWQRFSITQVASSGTRFPAIVTDGTAGSVFIWGAQLELGTAATTYNPTTVKNLLGFSEAFDNAAWTKIGSSIVTGAQANPVNGLFNAQKLMEDVAFSGHQALQAVVTTASPWTFSVFVKAGGRNWTALGITDSGGTVRITYFDLINGVVGTVATGITASIVAAGNGWYRCAVRVASAVAGSNNLRVYASPADGTTSYTGDGNSGIYIYGAQLSDSASLDPYAPTPGAAPSSTAYYGPRFDYDPVTLQPRGILIEEQRTNLALQSEAFDTGANWPNVNVSVTANASTSPSGAMDADRVIITANSLYTYIRQVITVTASTTYTFSFWMNTTTSAAGNTIRIFNITGGADIVAGQACVYSGGWVRQVCTFTTPVGCTSIAVYPVSINAGGSSAGTYFDLWGAQLEVGAFATSYIPTIASTVTRSADVATITGQNFGQFYRQDEGCLVVDALRVSIANPDAISVSAYTDFNNTIETFVKNADSRLYAAVGGAIQVNLIDASKVTAGVPFKTAAAYRLNDYAMATSGGTVLTDTSATVPAAAVLGIGSRNGSLPFNGWLRSIRYIPVRAADFQLQALTT